MSDYVDQHLNKDEILEYEAKISGWIFLIPVITALFFIVIGTANPRAAGVMYFIALCYILCPCIIKISTELAITNERIIGRSGFLSTKYLRLDFNQIESVKLSQNFLGRFLNYGNITIFDSKGNKQKFKLIYDPIALKAFISEKKVIKKSPD